MTRDTTTSHLGIDTLPTPGTPSVGDRVRARVLFDPQEGWQEIVGEIVTYDEDDDRYGISPDDASEAVVYVSVPEVREVLDADSTTTGAATSD